MFWGQGVQISEGTDLEFGHNHEKFGASLVTQMVKHLLAIQDTGVRSLGPEDSPRLGNGYPLHILVSKIPWTEEPGGLPSMGSQRVRHYGPTNTVTFSFIALL